MIDAISSRLKQNCSLSCSGYTIAKFWLFFFSLLKNKKVHKKIDFPQHLHPSLNIFITPQLRKSKLVDQRFSLHLAAEWRSWFFPPSLLEVREAQADRRWCEKKGLLIFELMYSMFAI